MAALTCSCPSFHFGSGPHSARSSGDSTTSGGLTDEAPLREADLSESAVLGSSFSLACDRWMVDLRCSCAS